MNSLSGNLRDLMYRQKMTGAKLAEEIGLSATSVSHILTGKTKPRQVTFSRMMKCLCKSKEDKQALLSSYESSGASKTQFSPFLDDELNASTNEERVLRFMEMKAQAISFRRDVSILLDKLALTYRPDVARGPVITDILIERGKKRIALECRANIHRDVDKSVISARHIREKLKCYQVLIVVPEFDSDLRDACSQEKDIQDLEMSRLERELSRIFAL